MKEQNEFQKVRYLAEPSPSPWFLDDSKGEAAPNTFWICDRDGHKICTVESYPSGSTGKADATLIRAAPDLLAACQAFSNLTLNYEAGSFGWNAIEKARAAILRATKWGTP